MRLRRWTLDGANKRLAFERDTRAEMRSSPLSSSLVLLESEKHVSCFLLKGAGAEVEVVAEGFHLKLLKAEGASL